METPEFFQASYYKSQFTPEKRLSDAKNGDHFVVEDLLDLPNDDGMVTDGTLDATVTGNSADSSVVDNSCNSSLSGSNHDPQLPVDNIIGCRNFPDGQFSSEFSVPYDDLAELEWLSNFVEESFSSNEMQKIQFIQGMKCRNDNETHQFIPDPNNNRASAATNPIFNPDMSVPAKARSKRSRMAPGNWASRLLVVSPNSPNNTPNSPMNTTSMQDMSSSSESGIISSSGKKTVKSSTPKIKKENTQHVPNNNMASNSEGRKCLHCATDKTPQWRTGPMGPKTLCNACGVRYKSGRLVPEYRPAASPTFVLTKHSNSHRKVLEIRRQKEIVRTHQQQQQFLPQNMMFDVSSADDYLIHQHIGPDFRHLI
ncbi:GATA transcription factor 9-like [Nicotiana tabacum]|uniref:GATA transcription factor n=2 Tax=Nicotiana TaxID=4085 RepID=A0A1S4DLF5_TOBAC|nr:PREDICTED: GATA transcription factor 12 [Nicotiana sylvestris]XP_016514226.1 PREDICTED: GATA transcription factor 9-like [Nicotiana tabacum]